MCKLLFKKKFGVQNVCLDIYITCYLLIQFRCLAYDKVYLLKLTSVAIYNA